MSVTCIVVVSLQVWPSQQLQLVDAQLGGVREEVAVACRCAKHQSEGTSITADWEGICYPQQAAKVCREQGMEGWQGLTREHPVGDLEVDHLRQRLAQLELMLLLLPCSQI